MNKKKIILKTANYIRNKMEGEGSGHDWWHIYRVWSNAKYIAKNERDIDIFIVELGALLHDIADWKFNRGDLKVGGKVATKWLKSLEVPQEIIKKVAHIVENVSFKGKGEKNSITSKEGWIVQDADRLDAMGAIGIARVFAYGGHEKRLMHNPEEKPVEHASFEEYKRSKSSSVNHFYEKLLLLRDLMNTETGKKIALGRHKFMEQYLEEFFKEWEGQA